jgi:hypothetical protein
MAAVVFSVGELPRDEDRLLIVDVLEAGLTARFLAVMDGLYAEGATWGQWTWVWPTLV